MTKTRKHVSHVAFTMAEILLSLTIIGVVAAITLPSLTGNINERTWNTQRKALYARMSQAISLMPALNGYGTVTEGLDANGSTITTSDNVAETFVTAGLSKVLKINNICDNLHLADCGIASSYTNMNATKKTMPTTLYRLNSTFHIEVHETGGITINSYHTPDTKAVAFETANGESILAFYNTYCQSELGKKSLADFAQAKMCANFIYDLNGLKGPNTMGKDMGVISVVYPSDSVVVAPVLINPTAEKYEQKLAGKACRDKDSEARLANLEEYMSMFYNSELFGFREINVDSSWCFWTPTLTSSTQAKLFHFWTGRIYVRDRGDENYILCVKR